MSGGIVTCILVVVAFACGLPCVVDVLSFIGAHSVVLACAYIITGGCVFAGCVYFWSFVRVSCLCVSLFPLDEFPFGIARRKVEGGGGGGRCLEKIVAD